MSELYYNRLVVTGEPPSVDAVENALRAHAEAAAVGRKRGRLSPAFGECTFAPEELLKEGEDAVGGLIGECEEQDRTAVIRVYPEVLRLHFVTNWLQCHREVKRIARRFPETRFRLDWFCPEHNTTGRLIVRGAEIEAEAQIPMWLEELYVLPEEEPGGSWGGFHDLGDISIFQEPVGRTYMSANYQRFLASLPPKAKP